MKSTLLPLLISFLALFAACSPSETKTEGNGESKTQSENSHGAGHSSEHSAEPPSDAKTTSEKAIAKVMFVSPQAGAKVKSPVKVEMGVEGMTVLPAGEMKEQTGHHHLIIDGQPLGKGAVVPKDETHIHFGKGQTSAEIELKPGKHTLTLQFADGAHLSYGPDLSATIQIDVE